MASKWMTELASLTGLTHYPNQGPFGQKNGALIGERDGYLLAIGPVVANNKKSIHIMLRFPHMEQPESFRAAANQSLENAATMPDSQRKAIKKMQIGADFFNWEWSYSFSAPKAGEVAALATAMVDAAKQVAPKFGGKCEICKSSSTSEILLRNNVPGYFCSGCQEKLRVEGEAADQAYEALPTNFPKGLLYGAAAAIVGGIAWGLVAYGLHRIFLWGAILIGMMVCWALFLGIGKINMAGRIAAFLLTVASVVFGDAIFFTLEVAKLQQVPVSFALLKDILGNIVEIETAGENVVSVLFALIGAGIVIYQKRKPKFTPEFTRPSAPSA